MKAGQYRFVVGITSNTWNICSDVSYMRAYMTALVFGKWRCAHSRGGGNFAEAQ